METKIDLKKVAAQKIRLAAANVIMKKSSADGRFLYYYKVFTFIEGVSARKLTESQATDKLKEFPKMPVTMWYDDSANVAPAPLKNRDDLVKRPFISLDDVKAFILSESGVEVSDEQLGADLSMTLRASSIPQTAAQKKIMGVIRTLAELKKKKFNI